MKSALPFGAGLPSMRQSIVASIARVRLPSGVKQLLPVPFSQPFSATFSTAS